VLRMSVRWTDDISGRLVYPFQPDVLARREFSAEITRILRVTRIERGKTPPAGHAPGRGRRVLPKNASYSFISPIGVSVMSILRMLAGLTIFMDVSFIHFSRMSRVAGSSPPKSLGLIR